MSSDTAGPELDSPGLLDLLVIGDCNPDVLALGADVTPDFGQMAATARSSPQPAR